MQSDSTQATTTGINPDLPLCYREISSSKRSGRNNSVARDEKNSVAQDWDNGVARYGNTPRGSARDKSAPGSDVHHGKF